MAVIADILSPADSARLAALGSQPTTAELAAAAREAAAESTGTGKLAWPLAARALDQSETTTQARAHLGAVIDSKLRTLALACTGALSRDGTNAVTKPAEGETPVSDLTILDEVNPGALTEASMLIRQVLEHEADLDAFHALEDQIRPAWMPQALACIAAYLVDELAEAQNKVRPDSQKVTPPQMLDEAINLIMHIKDRRDTERYQ